MSRRILLGLAGGIAVGLFFGERASVLTWPARAFIQLIQVTVLPYIVTSLVTGIAGGTPAQARRLAVHGGTVLVMLWVVGLTLAFLTPVALPDGKGGAFYATSAMGGEAPIDWIDLYIPSNPFRSLANNVVPAVVVFSALFGIALIGLPEKSVILGPLRLINDALGRAGSLLVKLTPFGIFAIVGNAAGTLRVAEFQRLQAYLLVWIGLSIILTLWILPGLVATLTSIRYRRIVSVMLAPLITAFVTSNLFIVLPLIQERAKELLGEAGVSERETEGPIDVLVPTSFTFPHAAKLLTLSFVLFAGWFAGTPVPTAQWPTLAGAGLLSAFGSLNSAIPFLLNLMRLPADLFQLYIVSGVVNGQFGSAAAAMHTLTLAVLGTAFMSGRVQVARARLVMFAAATVVIVGSFLIGSRVLLAALLPAPESAADTFDQLRVTGAWGQLAQVVPPNESDAPEKPESAPGHRLDDILQRGTVRVCVSPDAAPWCFLNGRREVVGFEVDVAHALAVQLHATLSLVTVARTAKPEALNNNTCDITMGRMVTSQAAAMAFSHPLTHEQWAFLALDYRRNDFATLEGIRELQAPTIAVFREAEFIERLEMLMPKAHVVPVDSIPEFLSAPPGRFDAMFTGFDRAAAASLMSPEYGVVVPAPDPGSVPIAFIVPKGEEALRDFANAVVEVGSANGLFKQKLDYWVGGLGKPASGSPRWSIGKDVLGWWKD